LGQEAGFWALSQKGKTQHPHLPKKGEKKGPWTPSGGKKEKMEMTGGGSANKLKVQPLKKNKLPQKSEKKGREKEHQEALL